MTQRVSPAQPSPAGGEEGRGFSRAAINHGTLKITCDGLAHGACIINPVVVAVVERNCQATETCQLV